MIRKNEYENTNMRIRKKIRQSTFSNFIKQYFHFSVYLGIFLCYILIDIKAILIKKLILQFYFYQT